MAEEGGGSVVWAQAWLQGLLRILYGGPVQVLGHSGCLARTVVQRLTLLLLLLPGLLALLLVGLFDITVMCTERQEQSVALLMSVSSVLPPSTERDPTESTCTVRCHHPCSGATCDFRLQTDTHMSSFSAHGIRLSHA